MSSDVGVQVPLRARTKIAPDLVFCYQCQGLFSTYGVSCYRYGSVDGQLNPPPTFGEADKLLIEYGQGLFGISK